MDSKQEQELKDFAYQLSDEFQISSVVSIRLDFIEEARCRAGVLSNEIFDLDSVLNEFPVVTFQLFLFYITYKIEDESLHFEFDEADGGDVESFDVYNKNLDEDIAQGIYELFYETLESFFLNEEAEKIKTFFQRIETEKITNQNLKSMMADLVIEYQNKLNELPEESE